MKPCEARLLGDGVATIALVAIVILLIVMAVVL